MISIKNRHFILDADGRFSDFDFNRKIKTVHCLFAQSWAGRVVFKWPLSVPSSRQSHFMHEIALFDKFFIFIFCISFFSFWQVILRVQLSRACSVDRFAHCMYMDTVCMCVCITHKLVLIISSSALCSVILETKYNRLESKFTEIW